MNYLLIGPEEYLKSQFLEELKRSTLSKTPAGIDFEIFQAGTSDISAILNSLNTLPFFAKSRIALIKNVEKFSPKEKNSILKYLKLPPRATSLVLSSPLAALNKFLTDTSALTKVIRCNRLKPGELNPWIRKEFEAQKRKISPALANIIIERSGSDLVLLKNEIKKIISFSKGADEIVLNHIEATLSKASHETAFELVDLVLGKRLSGVFLAVDSLLLKEKPHNILSLLAWQFRNFMKIKEVPKDASIDYIADRLKISRYFVKRARLTAEGFTKASLKKNLEIILEGDLFLKRGIMPPEDALERVLVRLCSG